MSDPNPLAVDQVPLDLDPAEATTELPADPPPWAPEEDGEAAPEQVASAAGMALELRPLDTNALTLEEVGKIGRVFYQSGYFRDARDAAQAITKILAGQELGIGPFASMNGFHIIEGKPAMSAGLIGMLVKRSGKYDFRVTTTNEEECILDWYQGTELIGQSRFTMTDATRAKLVKPNSGWEKYPAAMLYSRALTAGARMYAPDVFSGAIYESSELTDGRDA
jgi:hypothetical protein